KDATNKSITKIHEIPIKCWFFNKGIFRLSPFSLLFNVEAPVYFKCNPSQSLKYFNINIQFNHQVLFHYLALSEQLYCHSTVP
ncbi:hypothetical protein, partial [Halalkalibacter lacteus]|uniref:hypothetical protein n=1 Tax=Halalkalibacter lacteus TaxID=3090663 RepID=UPI002FC86CAB